MEDIELKKSEMIEACGLTSRVSAELEEVSPSSHSNLVL